MGRNSGMLFDREPLDGRNGLFARQEAAIREYIEKTFDAAQLANRAAVLPDLLGRFSINDRLQVSADLESIQVNPVTEKASVGPLTGRRITVEVPFDGDPQLFDWSPSSKQLVAPGDEMEIDRAGKKLRFTLEYSDQQLAQLASQDAIKQNIKSRFLDAIAKNAGSLNDALDRRAEFLPTRVSQILDEVSKRLDESGENLGRLGLV